MCLQGVVATGASLYLPSSGLTVRQLAVSADGGSATVTACRNSTAGKDSGSHGTSPGTTVQQHEFQNIRRKHAVATMFYASCEGETGALCFNGLDDDCDGLIDGADPGCAGASPPPPPMLASGAAIAPPHAVVLLLPPPPPPTPGVRQASS